MMAVCALWTLPGCSLFKGAAACEAPPSVRAWLEAAERVNPDAHGRALPTHVQFIQIKDSVKLERASFQKLWNEPKELLGEDLLQTAEFVVAPGHEVKHWVQRDPKAQYVAAVGHFRQPLGYAWLAVAKLPPIPQNECAELRFKLQGYQIDFLRPSRRTP
ncbi:MAG TPA: type VI secretion system lipoprotein TssJ [Hyalangium sp.]|nr:type VI secretion system lipoprotein TssJ [Hyalangium sp.]